MTELFKSFFHLFLFHGQLLASKRQFFTSNFRKNLLFLVTLCRIFLQNGNFLSLLSGQFVICHQRILAKMQQKSQICQCHVDSLFCGKGQVKIEDFFRVTVLVNLLYKNLIVYNFSLGKREKNVFFFIHKSLCRERKKSAFSKFASISGRRNKNILNTKDLMHCPWEFREKWKKIVPSSSLMRINMRCNLDK